jgi:hypothetical protein
MSGLPVINTAAPTPAPANMGAAGPRSSAGSIQVAGSRLLRTNTGAVALAASLYCCQQLAGKVALGKREGGFMGSESSNCSGESDYNLQHVHHSQGSALNVQPRIACATANCQRSNYKLPTIK